jgi:adenylate cyclase
VIGRELGASYVLDGSVRRDGGRVRITARLADVATGAQSWAERFDRDLSDIFKLQDELARHIAGTLAIELDDRELERAKESLDDERAYDHFLRGKRQMWKEGETTLEARRHFESAIRIDPGLARAHAALAMTYIHEALQFPPRVRFVEALSLAHDCAESALSLDPSESFGHMAMSWVHLYRRNHDRARHHADLAIKLNPNDADTLANCVYILSMDGDFDTAIGLGLQAMNLNPRYPEWYASLLSAALFNARRFEESMEYRLHSPATFYDSVFTGAATLACLGRMSEAKEWADRAVSKLISRLGEDAVAERGSIQLLLDNNPFRHAAHAAHFAESMRLAGVQG